jgi:hypothetical protein
MNVSIDGNLLFSISHYALIVHQDNTPFKRITPLTAYVEGTTKTPTRMISKEEHATGIYGIDLVQSLVENCHK